MRTKVKYLDEEAIDSLRGNFRWGEVWFDEAVRTLGHIQDVWRKADYLTHSPRETGQDWRDRIEAQLDLDMLELEAKRVLKGVGRKRVRKRGAAIRHRANGIYNRFRDKVVRRAAEGLAAELERLYNRYPPAAIFPSGVQLGFYDYTRDPPAPVLWYPTAVIKIDLGEEEGQ